MRIYWTLDEHDHFVYDFADMLQLTCNVGTERMTHEHRV